MLTFVAFLPLPQPRLIGKPPISGAESQRLIRISLRRRLGGEGQGRTEKDGGPAGSHASFSVAAMAWKMRRKTRKKQLRR